MSTPRDKPPGALVVDFSTVQDFERDLQTLQASWARIPAAARPGLSRLLWLHPNGETVVYRAPLEHVQGDDEEG